MIGKTPGETNGCRTGQGAGSVSVSVSVQTGSNPVHCFSLRASPQVTALLDVSELGGAKLEIVLG